MAVMINCPACQRSIKAPDSVIGKHVKCPACQAAFTVTAAPPPELEPPLASIDDREYGGPHRRSPRQPGAFMDFLAFRKMITPTIIQILFWLGVAAGILGGLATVIVGVLALGQSLAWALVQILLGLAIMVVGPVLVRIYCEILMLFFRMNETLTEIKQGLEGQRRG
jgi:hypothetical protein